MQQMDLGCSALFFSVYLNLNSYVEYATKLNKVMIYSFGPELGIDSGLESGLRRIPKPGCDLGIDETPVPHIHTHTS